MLSVDKIRLLPALPPGQVKNLMTNSACKEILKKYGIAEE